MAAPVSIPPMVWIILSTLASPDVDSGHPSQGDLTSHRSCAVHFPGGATEHFLNMSVDHL